MPLDTMQADMASDVPRGGTHPFSFHISLAGLSNADLLSTIVPGYKFAIEKVMFGVQTAATTAAKAATITPKISGVAVSGGVLSLTSANCTPKGNVVNGSEISDSSPDNEGSETDSISLTASGVTSFVEGDGEIVMILRNREAGLL